MVLYTGILNLSILYLTALAAFLDVATRQIPNRFPAIIAVLGIIGRIPSGAEALGGSAKASVVLFAALLLLHARRLLGGGDVKLMSAITLGFSLTETGRFIIATVMVGGVLALLHLMGRWALQGRPPSAPPPRGAGLLRRVFCAERWRISRHGSLPYGVAIACGGIWVILCPGGS